ncbi:FecR family protein [Chitinophaga sp. 30R24]|uniref:FecR family protein n=1 Tax=Chitinophaga sp. 30R24 TaxID=3248838 RepID=UPI003B8FEAC3
MERKQVDKELLQRYLENDGTAIDRQLLQQYLTDPAYSESLDEFMQADWQQLLTAIAPLATDSAYQRFLDKTRMPVRKIYPWHKVKRIAAAAAVLLIVVATSWYGWQYYSLQRAALAWKVWETSPGKTQVVHLPDSSVVCLGSGSRLTYNAAYNKTNRELYLRGEAYFVVAHGGRYPFSVHTGRLTTVDIGTAFNIRSIPGMAGVDVTVASGKVAVHYQQQKFPLVQRERLHYDSITGKISTELVPYNETVGGWRNGILTFRHMPLREIMAELQRYYGTEIRFLSADESNITITSTIPALPLEAALDIICETAGVHYVQQNNVILIK